MGYPSSIGVRHSELSAKTPETIVYVKEASDMPVNPSSDVTYWLDFSGLIEVSEITVPAGGLFIRGNSSDQTGIGSTEDNFTLFNGVGGNVFLRDVYVTVSGSGSQVNDLTDATGNSAYECVGVNFYGCTSLGELNGYRQFSLLNYGAFGGSPELTLSGNMNGVFIDTCLTRSLDVSFSGSLFKSGTGLSLSSRFRSNMRVDLPANASFCDFTSSNFEDSSLLQINGGQFSRDGVISSGDNGFFPNLDPEDLVCEWYGNNGLRNTHEGGRLTLTTEATTTIVTAGEFVDAAGAWTASDLQHFDSPSNGQLRNIGKNPQEFLVFGYFYADSDPNDYVSVRITRWNEVDQAFEEVVTETQQVLSISGSRDVAIIQIMYPITLEYNDYAKVQITNEDDDRPIILEASSYIHLIKR